jgi:hypothetical protein
VIVNRTTIYPPGGLARRLCGGVAGWPAHHLLTASFTGVKIHSDSLLQLPDLIYKTYVPSSYIETFFFNTYLLMPGTFTTSLTDLLRNTNKISLLLQKMLAKPKISC